MINVLAVAWLALGIGTAITLLSDARPWLSTGLSALSGVGLAALFRGIAVVIGLLHRLLERQD